MISWFRKRHCIEAVKFRLSAVNIFLSGMCPLKSHQKGLSLSVPTTESLTELTEGGLCGDDGNRHTDGHRHLLRASFHAKWSTKIADYICNK